MGLNDKKAIIRIAITTGDPRPIFKQIVDGIGLAIAKGELAAGIKLPSVRALAMQLSINPNTVAKAYNELTQQGLVDARQGLGLFVKEAEQRLSNEEREKRLRQAIGQCVTEVIHLNYSHEQVITALRQALNQIKDPGSQPTPETKEEN